MPATIGLRTVGDALRKMRAATLTQLAADLAAPPREVEAMLAFWEHRGNVRRCETPAALGCGTTCRSCPVGTAGPPTRAPAHPDPPLATPAPVVYEWVGN